MIPRVFNTLSLLSAALAVCLIVLGVWTLGVDPRDYCVSINDTFHVGACRGRVEFFNNREYGPYHGSIVSLSDGSEFAERQGFGDAFGIYYRYFRRADSGAVLWTLSVSLAYPLIVLALLPATWAWLRWRARGASSHAIGGCH
jgi:hypothetical protein